MEIVINEQKCTGCNLCVFSCSEGAISCYATAELDKDKCNSCLNCIRFCPMGAIEAKEEGL